MTVAPAQSTGTFMLSKEIEILMSERSHLLRVAGAAAQFMAALDAKTSAWRASPRRPTSWPRA